MMAFLRERNFHWRTYISYYHLHHEEKFSWIPMDWQGWKLREMITSGIRKMQPELPYVLEASDAKAACSLRESIPDMNNGRNRRHEKLIGRYYENAFVSIVNETRFFSYFPNLSEKTLNPFYHYRPVVTLGPPGNLAYLRRLGFRTFGEFWDESYDEELDHRRRIELVFSLLEGIFALSPKQLPELLWEMQPALLHNRLNLHDLIQRQKHWLASESNMYMQ
jgi:hypothetical protein